MISTKVDSFEELLDLLEKKVEQYDHPSFIESDPISVPHLFAKKQDIEIIGFWTAILSWGQRTTIVKKGKELAALMDNSPHDFILNHQEKDLKRFESFKHRTFNLTDTLYFLSFFKEYYNQHDSLEDAFVEKLNDGHENVEQALIGFYDCFFAMPEIPERTRKHIATPQRNSACKRINMFLRWMVRKDEAGVDFGLWNKIKTSQLICPLDVHVGRIAHQLNLIEQNKSDWKTALELTGNLKKFDPIDPVKYDYALFGMGVMEEN